jgi:hypothetical protein
MPTGVYERTEYHLKRLSESHKGTHMGELHHNWKGGTASVRKKLYGTREYKLWRKAVFERDNYTCQLCPKPKKGGKLTVDHIKQWAYFPELRFDINNGRTLCIECHRKTHTWGKWDYKRIGKKMVGKVNSGSFKKGHIGYKG